MTKLEVSQWQLDEIESIVRHNPGGLEWAEANLVLKQNDNVYPVDEVLYVFFGPLANLLRWKRQVENDLGHYDKVIHAHEHHKIEGLRAKTKRVYDLDGDKTWYLDNYHDVRIKQTLENMYRLEASYGRAE